MCWWTREEEREQHDAEKTDTEGVGVAVCEAACDDIRPCVWQCGAHLSERRWRDQWLGKRRVLELRLRCIEVRQWRWAHVGRWDLSREGLQAGLRRMQEKWGAAGVMVARVCASAQKSWQVGEETHQAGSAGVKEGLW